MRAVNKALLYGRTVCNLKPIQIKAQIGRKLRKYRKPKKYMFMPSVKFAGVEIPELDGDETYIERFDVEGILSNEVELLHEKHVLTNKWSEHNASHLWNFNIHYLEFTIPLAVKYKKSKGGQYRDKWIEIIAS